MLYTLLHVIQVLSALALIGIILLQQGKGASMGAAFGAGASATVFGARGAGSVLTRITTILALVFFGVSFYMSYLSAQRAEARSLIDQLQALPSSETSTVVPPGDAPVIPSTQAPPASTMTETPAVPAADAGAVVPPAAEPEANMAPTPNGEPEAPAETEAPAAAPAPIDPMAPRPEPATP